jgi:hypothetical protein
LLRDRVVQGNGCSQRVCVGDDGRTYCEEICKGGARSNGAVLIAWTLIGALQARNIIRWSEIIAGRVQGHHK